MEEKVLIDRQTLKAIAVDTRLSILKHLSKRNYTLSELSSLLGLRPPTLKQHLDSLLAADLVKKLDSENKWKYYTLTEKGRRLVEPREIKVLFMFLVSLFGAIAFAAKLVSNFTITQTEPMLQSARSFGAMEEAMPMAMDAATAVPADPIPSVVGFLFFLALSAFLLGVYLKKTN